MDIVAQDAGKKLRKRCSLPDYNNLVMLNFTNNIQKEIEDWPAMSIEKNIVHGSDAPETAAFEIGYFFNRFEIIAND